jgi:hypothetical protein
MNNINNIDNIIKQDSAYFLSHNGLGDNITCIGAIKFLLKYYNIIYFLCKDIYNENIKLLFENEIINKNIITVPFNSNNEFSDCRTIITKAVTNTNTDIFISGFVHKLYLKHLNSRITHPDLLNYKQNDNGYSIEWSHIKNFYYDIGLDLSIYYNYFHINSSNLSKEYFENIKQYNIIFLHTKSSNREINLNNITEKYINDEDKIIICANKNVYTINNYKYDIANKYINIYIAYYIDIILNSTEIHVIDSCFSCIIHPLNITNKLKAQSINIYNR